MQKYIDAFIIQAMNKNASHEVICQVLVSKGMPAKLAWRTIFDLVIAQNGGTFPLSIQYIEKWSIDNNKSIEHARNLLATRLQEGIPVEIIEQDALEDGVLPAEILKIYLRILAKNVCPIIKHATNIAHGKIFVVGDSHSMLWAGWNGERFKQIPGVLVEHAGPGTAWNLIQAGASVRSRENTLSAVHHVLANGFSGWIILGFGEIDIRAHIFKHVARQEKGLLEIITECVNRYILFIHEIKQIHSKVAIWGPIASVPVEQSVRRDMPVFGGAVERNNATLMFTEMLRNLSGVPVISILHAMMFENGRTDPSLLFDQAHLSPIVLPYAIDLANEALGIDIAVPADLMRMMPFGEENDKFRCAIRSQLGPISAPCQRAHLLLTIGKIDAALEELQKVLAKEPDHAVAHHMLNVLVAASLSQTGEVDRIIAYMEQISIIRPTVDLFFNLGLIYERKKLFHKAVYNLRNVIFRQPDHIEAYCLLGSILWKVGFPEQAVGELQIALALDPECKSARQLLDGLVKAAPSMKAPAISTDSLHRILSTPSSQEISSELGLPPVEPVDLVDIGEYSSHYGALQLVADKLGMKSHTPAIGAFWPHAWDVPIGISDMSCYLPAPERVMLVAREDEASFIRAHGLRAKAVGLPFCYIDRDPTTKFLPKSLLVMAAHGRAISLEDATTYLDYIKSISHHFSRVVFSLPADLLNSTWRGAITKYGFDIVLGASLKDRNCLFRLRKLFDSFEYMTSNAKGSHIAYAALCGVKIFLPSAHFLDALTTFFSDPDTRKFIDLLLLGLKISGQRLEYVQYSDALAKSFSYEYVSKRHPWFFVEHQNAEPCVEWARQEIGFYNKVSFEELGHLFGWTKCYSGS